MPNGDLPGANGDGRLLIKWKTIGLVGALAGVGCLGVLITVVSIKDIDTLSTVALVLAILAFAIQIMIFVAQTAAATEQSKSTLEINSETKSILSELRARTQATNETLNGQFNKLLDKMLDVTRESESAAESPGSNSSEVFESFLQEMRSALTDVKREVNHSPRSVDMNVVSDSRLAWRTRRQRLKEAPTASVIRHLERDGLGRLSTDAAMLLARMVRRYMKGGGSLSGQLIVDEGHAGIDELRSNGLAKPAGRVRLSDKEEMSTMLELTDKGFELGRLITAESVGDGILALFPWLAEVRTGPPFSDRSESA
ncbi:hypothetical protein [Amycolatopsis sp. NPDC051372]|uniref:hypothetical protein n=1 Tax=Amycolatopsis sp. NPDC051372 TaxID=3155669 RepID=UPI00343ED692